MSPPEPRAALGARREHRPHPASPQGRTKSEPDAVSEAPDRMTHGDASVMLCVRVAPSLRRRVKLVAVSSGRPVQALAVEALEALCKQHDM